MHHRLLRRVPKGEDVGGACRGAPGLVSTGDMDRSGGYTYNAHALPCSNQGCNTNHETNSGQHSPATSGVTKSNQDGGYNSTNDASNTKTTSEDHARSIAVANSPTYEIGMCLVAERPFDSVYNTSESRRVGCGGEGME